MNYSHLTIPKQTQNLLKSFKDKIVVRFPPEPSGYLHLGHIKAFYINACVAKHYEGKLLIRFDDTNPTLESNEYERAIIEDLKILKPDINHVTYTSDYFDKLLDYADILINKGLAYVDLTGVDLMRKMREESTPSQYRDDDPSIVKNRWNLIRSGKTTEGILRLKTDLAHKNKAMRDPTIYRHIPKPHHRTGNKHVVYPTYDYACPIVDALEGVTHVFRSVEYNERNDQASFILKHLDFAKPIFIHYGRIGIKDAELSKRKIKESIENKKYDGWDDIRLYTLRGLLKRGLKLSALEDFMKDTSFPTVPVILDPAKLWHYNKMHIDMQSTRYMVIDDQNKVYFVPCESKNKQVPKYISNQLLGTRISHYDGAILISDDIKDKDVICLINWVSKQSFEVNGNQLIPVEKKTNRYIPWTTKDFVKVKIITIQGDALVTTNFYGEKALYDINLGDYIQLYQKGYYLCTCKNETEKTVTLTFIC